MFDATDKVKSLHHFERFADDLLCCKQADLAYILVKKTYPAYEQLRFRKHVLNLLIKVGDSKAIDYKDLVPPEFEPYARRIWTYQPQFLPYPQSKVVLRVMLETSAIVAGKNAKAVFANAQPSIAGVKQGLIDYPVGVITKKSELDEHWRAVQVRSESQYKLWLDTPYHQEVSFVKDALETFRAYYDQEVADLDNKVDSILTDPKCAGTKIRRKARDMRELKEKAPDEFQSMLGICKGQAEMEGRIMSTEDILALSEATLSHQYRVSIIFCADGKFQDMQLHI